LNSKILIIIPVFNEEGNVKPLLNGIFKYFKKNKSILFINDNSQDKTKLEIKECQKKFKNIYLENRKSKLGIGSAHKFALRWAYRKKYKIIITMDCDGTHHPKYINKMIKLMVKKKCDIVSTNRFLKKNSMKGWSLWRKLITYTRFLVINTLFNIKYDSSGAYRCYNANNVNLKDLLKAKDNSYSFFWQSTLILNKKYYIDEIPIKLPARNQGFSKMKIKDILSGLYHVLLFRFRGF
jgi:dolichol-phosphate mannosyltransferase